VPSGAYHQDHLTISTHIRAGVCYNTLVIGQGQLFLDKAQESLAGAQSEFVNGRYNNCANRCYYACFQAAIHALAHAGIQPTSTPARWGHDFVQAQFAGQLVYRRKLYPREMHEALVRTYGLRQAADYRRDLVSETQARRALGRTREFLATIQRGGERV
jgi:uncharacterized protein (UPF0332 family)